MRTLKLKANSEYKYKLNYPWGFVEDFEKIPDNLSLNQLVEVRDSKNQLISKGYVNPKSQIFYRALSFDSRDDLNSKSYIADKIVKCWSERKLLGYDSSCRICFSENDFLPGLILDYFKLPQGQVFVLQILTLGMQNLIQDALDLIQQVVVQSIENNISDVPWQNTAIVIRNDSKVREKEGLIVSVPHILKDFPTSDLKDSEIILDHFFLDEKFSLNANLNEGQKTGFFLDQNYNLLRTAELFEKYLTFKKPTKVKILDICCYLGQWSVYFGLMLKKLEIEAEFVLLDISSEAITKAQKNLDRYGIKYKAVVINVLEQELQFENKSFDLVIVDPPAFVKNKKSLPTGKHAYQKLNSKALPLVKDQGFIVSCSCSGLLSMPDFKECVQKAFVKTLSKGKCIAQGGHAPDHPFLLSFPEGNYLKMLLHLVG